MERDPLENNVHFIDERRNQEGLDGHLWRLEPEELLLYQEQLQGAIRQDTAALMRLSELYQQVCIMVTTRGLL